MINRDVDVAVIGAGPAGLASAISARENGAEKVVILDRNTWVGGILPQCIHDGFGVEETGQSLTGPEYAEKYVKQAEKNNIEIMRETMVLNFTKDHVITAINRKGIYQIKSKSIVLAMGCREKTRWHSMIPGTRPSGIYTAGVVQAFINLYNIMPGRNVLILGSGDVGLIMARRLKLEGANVLGVVEMLPYASGLPRNVVQCLHDYNIPLFLNHTVVSIEGRERLEKVVIAQVDDDMHPIPETEKHILCDTLLLSLGLIPENELSKDAGVEIDELTGGPIVDQNLETSIDGVFACGNCLQVYDTVDMLSIDAKHAGKNAAEKINKIADKKLNIKVVRGRGVRYVLPQRITSEGFVRFTLRAEKPAGSSVLRMVSEGREIFKKNLRWINPANMIFVDFKISSDVLSNNKTIEVSLNEY